MPRLTREGETIVNLTGPRAARLAASLLAPKDGLDPAWAEIAAHSGRAATRVAHDWDPAARRLTIAASAQA